MAGKLGHWLDEARRACDATLDPHSPTHSALAEWVLKLALDYDDTTEDLRKSRRRDGVLGDIKKLLTRG